MNDSRREILLMFPFPGSRYSFLQTLFLTIAAKPQYVISELQVYWYVSLVFSSLTTLQVNTLINPDIG